MNVAGPTVYFFAWTLVFTVIPFVAFGWALVTLQRIRLTQSSMQQALVSIEERLQHIQSRAQ